jgi:hypothetical protein
MSEPRRGGTENHICGIRVRMLVALFYVASLQTASASFSLLAHSALLQRAWRTSRPRCLFLIRAEPRCVLGIWLLVLGIWFVLLRQSTQASEDRSRRVHSRKSLISRFRNKRRGRTRAELRCHERRSRLELVEDSKRFVAKRPNLKTGRLARRARCRSSAENTRQKRYSPSGLERSDKK